ncbi:MAG: hypothetical protein WKG07_37865 [Hymenobacter sp.]
MLVVLSDVKLPDGHGVELLPRYQRRRAAGRGGAAHGLRHHSRRGEGHEARARLTTSPRAILSSSWWWWWSAPPKRPACSRRVAELEKRVRPAPQLREP